MRLSALRGPGSLALVLLALAWASPTSAQERAFDERVDAATLALVQPILEQAARDSLPVAALRAKVLEGVAKGVDGRTIGRVVSELAGEFRSVRSGLQGLLPQQTLTAGEVVAAAMAARQGVSLEALQGVWEARSDGASLDVPVTVLGELVRRGVPVPEAVGLMSHVVQTQVPMSVAAQIPGRFDGARGSGAPPGQALSQAIRQLNIPDPPRGPPGRGQGQGQGRRPGG